VALENSGEHTQAITHFQEALKLDENDFDAMTGLAVAFYNAGRTYEGCELAKKCLAIRPENATCRKIIEAAR
jgi:Flp pilus assembly protein TadD